MSHAIDAIDIWSVLGEVHDPEIPVVSIVDLGLIQGVEVSGAHVRVSLTPTFAGCPALHVMRREIEERLRALGADPAEVVIVLSPPWTTDRITSDGREQLRAFGLAPAPFHGGNVEIALTQAVECPYCHSLDTVLKNGFGPTACRSIHYCNNCQQPFEAFKPI